uniref:Uncharacterized protein n=1 Tax=Branchiostoma floridae TaxID=7739 RepID=C3Y582_BRAFL|eukprot:XP_002608605.1 hypothetical protein BRAFLDRAFT_96131 [Branchiostoma floridae]
MTENVDAVVREPNMSGDLEGFISPAKKKQSVRQRKTAPGRQELYGRPSADTQSNVRERTTITTHAVVHKEPSLPRKEGAKTTQTAVQTSSSPSQDDELDQLYENRKATPTVSRPAAVRPKELKPHPAIAPCRPPDPLYVRREGQRFWSTKRILDWQRQALRAREDPGAVLKPVTEYGEDAVLDYTGNGEADFQNHGSTNFENNREHAHYENDREHTHYEDDREHKYYQYDKNHAHYENDRENAHYENDREHTHNRKLWKGREDAHYENDGEHKYYQYDKKHAHYENDRNHAHYENDREHAHYENDREHAHYEDDGEHKYYQYDKNHADYENDTEHAHNRNDREHKYYQYDKNHGHYQNDREHAHNYENDEEQSNLSTHVYADLDPDFLAAQDAIQNASAQPFYEMDISPADDEQEQPFYKMDATAAKDKLQKGQPFYEMDVVSAADGEKEEQPFYQMDDSRLGKSASSSNVYADLDPEFVAAQDEACRRHRVREQNRGDDNDDARCSQNCRVFSRSRLGRMVAVGVGVIIAAIAITVVSVVFNRSDDLIQLQEKYSPPFLADWQSEWALYIREYFAENSDPATALEEGYAANDVVMSLLQDRFFWPWVCRYWNLSGSLPCTLAQTVAFCVKSGTSSEYMTSHGFLAYSDFFFSVRNALAALQNVTTSTDSVPICVPAVLSLSHTLSDNDVAALVNLFPYLEGTGKLFMPNCNISANAATSMAEHLQLLTTLTHISLQNNKIGDDGIRAIAEIFPHLKRLEALDIRNNAITEVGGEAMAKRLIHLQELQKLYLSDNALALSLSSLAKAFVNMSRLEYVTFDVKCRAASFRVAAQQARDAVHTIAGQVRTYRVGTTLYDGSRAGDKQELAWQRVKQELQTGVHISRERLMVFLRIKLLRD